MTPIHLTFRSTLAAAISFDYLTKRSARLKTTAAYTLGWMRVSPRYG